jgi:hypothetical protein
LRLMCLASNKRKEAGECKSRKVLREISWQAHGCRLVPTSVLVNNICHREKELDGVCCASLRAAAAGGESGCSRMSP